LEFVVGQTSLVKEYAMSNARIDVTHWYRWRRSVGRRDFVRGSGDFTVRAVAQVSQAFESVALSVALCRFS
jgi:hypothetical protein